MNFDEIITRMVEIAGAKNPSGLAAWMGRDRSTISNWRRKNKIPDDAIQLVALKTGCREEWIKTGEGPKSDLACHTDNVVREAAEPIMVGLQFDGRPLTQREQNEIAILRWLETHAPEIRERIADEIVHMYIMGVEQKNGEGG